MGHGHGARASGTGMGMAMTDQVVFNRAIQALRVPDGQLPIILSALETRPDRFSVDSLKDITIRMYETHRPKIDTTEVYVANNYPPTESQGQDETMHAEEYESEEDWQDSLEVTMEDGNVFLMKPKKPTKPRNAPGMHEAAKRGAVNAFRHIPNHKGQGPRIRCGDPSHHWKECPHPFRGKLDSRFSTKGKGKGKGKPKGKGTYVASESLDESVPEYQETDCQVEASAATCVDSSGGCDSSPCIDNAPPAAQASINDVWAQYYTRYHDSPKMIGVCNVTTPTVKVIESQSSTVMHATQTHTHQPPILIDSGASSSVVGMKWLQSWNQFVIPKFRPNQKEFHFGDGPACRSLGDFDMNIELPSGVTNRS